MTLCKIEIHSHFYRFCNTVYKWGTLCKWTYMRIALGVFIILYWKSRATFPTRNKISIPFHVPILYSCSPFPVLIPHALFPFLYNLQGHHVITWVILAIQNFSYAKPKIRIMVMNHFFYVEIALEKRCGAVKMEKEKKSKTC